MVQQQPVPISNIHKRSRAGMTETETLMSQSSSLVLQIEASLLQILHSAERVLLPDTTAQLQARIPQLSSNSSVVQCIQALCYALLGQVDKLQQAIHLDVDREDYHNLEAAVQKAEAEIRKHIRLEQQLKIYMDGLEEKVEKLERQLHQEGLKYAQLFECMRVLDEEKKDLARRLRGVEAKSRGSQEKEARFLSHKASKLLTEPAGYEGRLHDRSKISQTKKFIDKPSDKKSYNLNPYVHKKLQNQINISLKQSPQRKKTDIDRSDIKQMTKTIQLKQGYRKQSRKLLKYSSDHRSILNYKKDARSNSVCS